MWNGQSEVGKSEQLKNSCLLSLLRHERRHPRIGQDGFHWQCVGSIGMCTVFSIITCSGSNRRTGCDAEMMTISSASRRFLRPFRGVLSIQKKSLRCTERTARCLLPVCMRNAGVRCALPLYIYLTVNLKRGYATPGA